MKTVVSKQQIRKTISTIAKDIRTRYPDEPPTLVILLEGARRFADDLLEHLPPHTQAYFLKAASYHGTMQSSGSVTIDSDTPLNLKDKKVLIIDDIYDTGRTIHAVSSYLQGLCPAEVKTCVLIIKRRDHEQPIPIDFAGMEVEDLFLIGYGLDYRGKFRELDEIIAVEGETEEQLMDALKKRRAAD